METVVANNVNGRERQIYDSMVALLGRASLDYRGGFVDAESHRIHYLDYGDGPPVLLIHGGGAGGAIWFRQMAALRGQFRVIAPDNPVFGLSSRPGYRVPVGEITSGYLRAFMDAMGIGKASLVGHSIGGYVAARLAAENPELVERLVLVSSAGFGRHLPWGFRLTAMPFLGRILSRPNRWAHERFFESIEVANPTSPDAGAYLDYAHTVTTGEGHAESLRRNIPTFAGLFGQKNVLSEVVLGRISARTLVIWGREDRFFPLEHADRAARLISDSRLEVLEDCGHIALLDQPEALNGMLRGFLNGR